MADAPQPERGVSLQDRLALRLDEVATALGVCDRTIRSWIRDEALPCFHVGRVLLIPTSKLRSWIEQRTQQEQRSDTLVDEILDDLK